MRLNESTILIGKRVILVPYRAEHVARYHEWMEDEELRTATASERLTLEEEYEMQRKWHLDPDKLTFIILSREPSSPSIPPSTSTSTSTSQWDATQTSSLLSSPMIGDVNLFLTPPGTPPSRHCEMEIMIASKGHRRRGLGRDALKIFLSYCTLQMGLKPSEFCAKVGIENGGSRRLFESLGFVVGKESEVWKEVEYWWLDERWRWDAGEDRVEWEEVKFED
ncbi:acyl-CoA N-acyltransferase [Atractiella rhizophila]|nr:acyl-CoA N-acyltransferase [Atractiella rhizophila]